MKIVEGFEWETADPMQCVFCNTPTQSGYESDGFAVMAPKRALSFPPMKWHICPSCRPDFDAKNWKALLATFRKDLPKADLNLVNREKASKSMLSLWEAVRLSITTPYVEVQ
jgi:hypothetical protein